MVKDSTIHGAGYGLFTTRKIRKGELICRYSGDILDSVYGRDTTWTAEVAEYDSNGGAQNCVKYIDSTDICNFSGRWMNHSYEPNARLVIPRDGKTLYDHKRGRWYIFVECERDIDKGKEIFINYGRDYYTFTELDGYGDTIKFLNFEYYSGVTGKNLDNLQDKVIFTFEKYISSVSKKTIIIK